MQAAIGGWLLFLCFVLTVVGPCFALLSPTTFKEILPPLSFAAVCAVAAAMVGWSVYAGLALWNRWSDAPRIASHYLFGSLVVTLATVVIGVLSGVLVLRLVFFQFPATIVSTFVWLVYLQRSKRVAATFGVHAADVSPTDRVTGRALAVLVAAVFLLLSSAIYQREDWVTHTSATGRYSVEGLRPLQLNDDEAGERTAAFGNGYRSFTVTDFALQDRTGNDGEVLEALRNHVLGNLSASLLHDNTPFLLGPHSALRFTATFVHDGLAGEAIATAVLANGRGYLLVATGNAGGRIRGDAERFLTSFRIAD
jgi:hypothetical protein